MSEKSEKSFFFTLKEWKKVDGLMKKLDEKKIPYLYITEWGTVPVNCQDSDLVKLVVDVSNEKYYYIATPDFLDKSKDGIFVHLRKPNEKPKKLPNFEDVFEVREI